MRKLFAAAALGSLALVPFQAQAANDSVVVGMQLEPPGLDPTTGAAAAISQITLYNLFEGLTRIDADGKVQPLLAESWTTSDDYMTWTFKLRSGVTFHDGEALDSSDVKFTFEHNAVEGTQNKRADRFRNMESIETPDATTVVIKLKTPSATFLASLAEATAVIVDPSDIETNETEPVGSGPFKFVKWNKGQSVELAKYDGYRDAADIKLNSVTFRFVADAAAQAASLLSGDVDYYPLFGAVEALGQFENNPDFEVLVGTTNGETILSTNNKAKALSDLRVRQAIAHAINRKELIDGAMYGYGTPIGSHFAPHHPAYEDLTGTYPYDPEKSKALLKEAGYGDGLELSLKLPPTAYARNGGQIIADQLGKVGITAKIENVEWAQWLDQVYKKKNYDLSIVSHVEPMDIGIYARPDYYFQYENPTFNELIEKADSAVTEEEQDKYLREAQEILAKDAVNGYLFQLAKVAVYKKGLVGAWKDSHLFANDMARMHWEN
ncbi:ABC transporter substrate-binding protein [Oceanibacterium hippocampi]|uniref:Glutathione-binding protein GsiB n=1 Tax=Oceanibacterium hippocampi TaxID=745714 RepID=A0A1Y5RU31_9PROT|nr:ABC transporter substrate-binding protein [Oceanibacterium hippocampi]SLN25433.1 Glutathione-binding protein GsiB precursor [Oceanibacterium hippocampi]